MVLPFFILVPDDFRISQLIDHVVVVITKSMAEQALYVFEQEGNRLYFPDCTDCLRKEVARIGMAAVLSSQREGLAWWTAADKLTVP